MVVVVVLETKKSRPGMSELMCVTKGVINFMHHLLLLRSQSMHHKMTYIE